MIDWHSSKSEVFVNPKSKEPLPYQWERFNSYPGHVWLSTSGSITKKWVAISKKAMLHSAEAVNQHFNISSDDRWGLALPFFHVGGLSIHARAFLSHTPIATFKHDRWDAFHFIEFLKDEQVTITSLVSTQLYDLIKRKIHAPKTLRVAIIGGGALSEHLYSQAKALGWPVVPTYGMTECSSQIATGNVDQPELKILPHITYRLDDHDRLEIKSEALLTGYLTPKWEWQDPKQNGFLKTDDIVSLDGSILRFLGRKNDMIKIGGEKVFLQPLLDRFESFYPEGTLLALPDDRLDYIIVACVTSPIDITPFNATVMPFERIRRVYHLPLLPRTALGKIDRNKLLTNLTQHNYGIECF